MLENVTIGDKAIDLGMLSEALLDVQRLAGIGTLTASVAHELTNPISIITSTCNNLMSQVEDGGLSREELQHYINVIEDSAWRCARLVQTLRNYAHTGELRLASCELNRLIADALTLVSYQFERRYDITIETDLDPTLAPVTWDQNRITQVLINLLVNARDALAETGSTIRITSWAAGPDTQAFSIGDDGPGIPPEIMGRIFEPLFTTKPLGQGAGLGLAIVQTIVELHQGTVTAANNPGRGATFTVVLPVRP